MKTATAKRMLVSEAVERFGIPKFTIHQLLRKKCLTRWLKNPTREKAWVWVYEDEMENAKRVLDSDLDGKRKLAAMRSFKAQARGVK